MRILTFGVSLLFVTGAAVWGCGCGKAVREVAKTAEAPAASDSISTFTLVGHTETGRKKWEVQGETADLLGETVHLSPVRAVSFGQVDVRLTAKKGQFHKISQDVHLEKDVVVTTSDGARLTTDTLDWVAEREMGKTPDWVTVTRPGMTVVGKAGIGYPKLKRVRLEREVTVTIQGQTGLTRVTCDGPMEVDYGRRKARFWRNVRVEDDKGHILSDRLDVVLDPEVNQIAKATFWGHVRIHRKDQLATANRANYWKDTGRMRLIGHPKLAMLPKEYEE